MYRVNDKLDLFIIACGFNEMMGKWLKWKSVVPNNKINKNIS